MPYTQAPVRAGHVPGILFYMRDLLIVLGMCVAAISLGIFLYLHGPEEFREVPAPVESETSAAAIGSDESAIVPFTVIAEGSNAANAPVRKNYAAYSSEDFAQLWAMAYGEGASPIPAVDFSDSYVIGIFLGEKPTGGYAIRVDEVADTGSLRNVSLVLTSPGEGCLSSQALTRPFQIITVPLSDRSHTRTEAEELGACR